MSESGNIYFAYKPKVNVEDPKGAEDVARLFMIFEPHRSDQIRLAIIAAKQLPDSTDSRTWGFIEKVSTDPKEIRDALLGYTYKTKTAGTQLSPTARPVGEGVYAITQHEDHTHFAYRLEIPNKPDEQQEVFNISEEGDFIISVVNPEKERPEYAGLSDAQEAKYPAKLQKLFKDNRFANLNPTQFLDYDGAQFLLIFADEKIDEEELGIRLKAEENERLEHSEMIRNLRMSESKFDFSGMTDGEWD